MDIIENNESKEVVTVEQTDLDLVLAKLDLESSDTRNTRRTLLGLKERISQLSERLSGLEKQDNAKRSEVIKLAKRLLKEGLNVDAVFAALNALNYNRPRKIVPVGDARKSHKIDQAEQDAILDFVTESHGVSAKDIWDRFPALDKQGVSAVVRKLFNEKKITAQGNTRKRHYYPVAG